MTLEARASPTVRPARRIDNPDSYLEVGAGRKISEAVALVAPEPLDDSRNSA